jgi:hypothetical protein
MLLGAYALGYKKTCAIKAVACCYVKLRSDCIYVQADSGSYLTGNRAHFCKDAKISPNDNQE